MAVIRQFAPNWFTVTMGTGILALMLDQLPYTLPGVHPVAEALWCANTGLFALFCLMYLARWLIYPREAARIFGHPVMPMFLGAIPMSLATVVNGLLSFGIARWGQGVVPLAQGLWWLDAALALAAGCVVPFLMFTRQDHRLETMTAVWLLPIVACEVAAGSDGLLIRHLADPAQAVTLLYLGYVLWACSVPLALSVLAMLFLRLALHKLPARDMAMSGWLCLGPLGMGAFGLLTLGQDAGSLSGQAGVAVLGQMALGVGIMGALALWGYGVWWLALAVMKTASYLRHEVPFNLGWWGLTFPLGTYALATVTLGRQTGAALFQVAGEALVLLLAGLWLLVAIRTLHGAVRGYLFVAPCLDEHGSVAANP